MFFPLILAVFDLKRICQSFSSCDPWHLYFYNICISDVVYIQFIFECGVEKSLATQSAQCGMWRWWWWWCVNIIMWESSVSAGWMAVVFRRKTASTGFDAIWAAGFETVQIMGDEWSRNLKNLLEKACMPLWALFSRGIVELWAHRMFTWDFV